MFYKLYLLVFINKITLIGFKVLIYYFSNILIYFQVLIYYFNELQLIVYLQNVCGLVNCFDIEQRYFIANLQKREVFKMESSIYIVQSQI